MKNVKLTKKEKDKACEEVYEMFLSWSATLVHIEKHLKKFKKVGNFGAFDALANVLVDTMLSMKKQLDIIFPSGNKDDGDDIISEFHKKLDASIVQYQSYLSSI